MYLLKYYSLLFSIFVQTKFLTVVWLKTILLLDSAKFMADSFESHYKYSIFFKVSIPFFCFNPITYGEGGDFWARTIRLSTTTQKRLYLAPPNLVNFCFYLLDTFCRILAKLIHRGGLLQLFLK